MGADIEAEVAGSNELAIEARRAAISEPPTWPGFILLMLALLAVAALGCAGLFVASI